MYDICLFNWVAAPLDRPESVTDPIIIYRASKVRRGYLSEDFCERNDSSRRGADYSLVNGR